MMNRFAFLRASTALAASAWPAAASAAALPRRRVSGLIVSINANTLVVQKRNGKLVTVDLSEAAANQRVGVLAPDIPIVLHGEYNPDGTFHCTFTSHAGPRLVEWAEDQ